MCESFVLGQRSLRGNPLDTQRLAGEKGLRASCCAWKLHRWSAPVASKREIPLPVKYNELFITLPCFYLFFGNFSRPITLPNLPSPTGRTRSHQPFFLIFFKKKRNLMKSSAGALWPVEVSICVKQQRRFPRDILDTMECQRPLSIDPSFNRWGLPLGHQLPFFSVWNKQIWIFMDFPLVEIFRSSRGIIQAHAAAHVPSISVHGARWEACPATEFELSNLFPLNQLKWFSSR